MLCFRYVTCSGPSAILAVLFRIITEMYMPWDGTFDCNYKFTQVPRPNPTRQQLQSHQELLKVQNLVKHFANNSPHRHCRQLDPRRPFICGPATGLLLIQVCPVYSGPMRRKVFINRSRAR